LKAVPHLRLLWQSRTRLIDIERIDHKPCFPPQIRAQTPKGSLIFSCSVAIFSFSLFSPLRFTEHYGKAPGHQHWRARGSSFHQLEDFLGVVSCPLKNTAPSIPNFFFESAPMKALFPYLRNQFCRRFFFPLSYLSAHKLRGPFMRPKSPLGPS